LKQNCMGSPLGAAKYNSLLQGAASLDRLGTTAREYCLFISYQLVLCSWTYYTVL